ncbi:MAG: hypothetical protein IJ607_02895 [Bacteroidaceae bacterium]|nr:hypothetical protein [Bacteroidaceae bacterium]
MKKNYFMLLLMTVMMAVGGGKAWGQTTYYSEDFSSQSTDGWKTGTGGRFTPTILEENGNYYLSVAQGERNNNGATVTGTALAGKVAAGTDFTMTFDMKLSSSTNQSPVSLVINDAANSDKVFSLTATGTWTSTWILTDGTTQVTLPNSNKGNSSQTIADVTWCSYVITHKGDAYYVTITNKETGAAILERTLMSGGSSTGGIGNVIFTTRRYFANFAIDNIVIRSCEAGDYPDETPVSYTINYECDGVIVKTVSKDDFAGYVATLTSSDKSNFTVDDDHRYIYVGDNASEQTIAADGSTVVTVYVREAVKYAYNITSSYEGTALDWATNGEVWEDLNTITVSYPRFQALGTTLVERAPVSNNLTVSVTVTENGYTQDLAYSATGIENLYLLSEAENLETGLGTNSTSFVDRVSNRAIILGSAGTLVTLPAGSYIFTLGAIGGDGNTHQVAYTVSAGETQIIEGTCTGNWLTLLTSEEFSLTSDTPITFTCSDPASNRGIDLIYIQKTADAQTTGYTINYQYEGETLQTETGDAVVGAEVEAQESITVTTGEGEEATTQTYYVAENQTSSMTIDADAANNVLNVALRLPATLTYTIDAVDANESVLAEIGTGTFTEGESATAYWSKYINVNGQWYETTAPYGATISTEGSTNVKYSGSDITYFYEIEKMKTSRSAATSQTNNDKYSGGIGLGHTGGERFYTTEELEGGVYTITVNGYSRRSGNTNIGISYIDKDGALHNTEATLTWTNSGSEAISMTVQGVNIPSYNKGIALVELTGYNSVSYLDYVTLTKTGDAQTELITITSACAATYCSENPLNFETSEALSAYYLTMDGDELIMSNAMVVPANTGIYLEGAEGTYEIPIADANADTDAQAEENVLEGVLEATQIEAPIYVLMYESNGVGFYKTKNTFTVGAHTAYIPGSAVPTGVKALNINSSDDPTTAILGISNDAVAGKDAVIYNLAGQRVAAPTKGIYIVNGKKVMVK